MPYPRRITNPSDSRLLWNAPSIPRPVDEDGTRIELDRLPVCDSVSFYPQNQNTEDLFSNMTGIVAEVGNSSSHVSPAVSDD